MGYQWLRAALFRIVAILDAFTFASIGVVLGSLRWDPKQMPLPPWLSSLLLWCQATGAVLLTVLFVASYLCRAAKRFLRPPHLQKQLRALLDGLQKELFRTELSTGEPAHEHRVTLFRKGWAWRFCRWPWSGWLCPVERSGHLTRKAGSFFRVSDNPGQLQGVVGQAWARGAVIIEDLPDLEEKVDPVLHKQRVEEYAARTGVTPRWLLRRLDEKRPIARSFCGYQVEVSGTMWGVLIIDSRNPKAKAKGPNAKVKGAKDEYIRFFVGVLGKVLEGG